MARSVLVVDDESVVLEITKRKLEEKGYEVYTAGNGEEAFLRLKSKIPDLILLDIQMPRMNGYTFIKEKNKIPKYANIPLAVLTAHDEMEPFVKDQDHGIKAYLLKPFAPQDVIDKVVEIIGQP
jgi:CheY-like chemotaxis protein